MFASAARERERSRTLLMLDAPSASSDSVEPKNKKPGRLFTLLAPIFGRAGVGHLEQTKLGQRWAIEALIILSLLFFGKFTLALMFLGLVLVSETALLRVKESKRITSFEQDYPTLLIYLATSVRTGQDPLTALCGAARTFAKTSIVAEEVKKFNSAIEQGVPEDQALLSFAESIRHPDIALFRTAMILSRREGASLSTCLQRLARVTRQRQSFRRKVRSAVALQKISAYAIAACTVVIGMVQYSANPEVVRNAWDHPMGAKVLQFGVFMIVLGIIWMRHLVASRTS